MYSHGKPPIGGFLPGRNPNQHANVDFSWGEIHIFHANVALSRGEIHLFPWEVLHWWISPREKTKHTCKCGFLRRGNPHVSCKYGFLLRRNPFIPMVNPPCKCGFLPRRNPHIPFFQDLFSRLYQKCVGGVGWGGDGGGNANFSK